MNEEKRPPIGALWSKIAKNGYEYFSGYVEINGEKHQIVIFENPRKGDGEKYPVFRIYESRPLLNGSRRDSPYPPAPKPSDKDLYDIDLNEIPV